MCIPFNVLKLMSSNDDVWMMMYNFKLWICCKWWPMMLCLFIYFHEFQLIVMMYILTPLLFLYLCVCTLGVQILKTRKKTWFKMFFFLFSSLFRHPVQFSGSILENDGERRNCVLKDRRRGWGEKKLWFWLILQWRWLLKNFDGSLRKV